MTDNFVSGCVREATIVYGDPVSSPLARIGNSAGVSAFIRATFGSRVCESFIVVALDARQRPVAWSEIARGQITSCQVAVSDVLRFALLAASPAFIIAHNHPSGDPTPSPEDIALTDRIVSAAHVVWLRCLDHVIVSTDRSYSFVDSGAMPIGGAA